MTLDGKRPLIGEIQALLAKPANPAAPQRAAVSSIDQSRVAMINAVLENRASVPIGAMDVSTVGGMRLTDPSCDLAVAMALASAFIGSALPATVVVIGEVGLAGDLRRGHRNGPQARRSGPARLQHGPGPGRAQRAAPKGLRTMEAATIGQALRMLVDLTDSKLRAVPPPGREGAVRTPGSGWGTMTCCEHRQPRERPGSPVDQRAVGHPAA